MTSFRFFLFPARKDLSSRVAPLQNFPLYIPGMVRPIVDGDGGISIKVFEENENGVFCLIDPYPGMGEDDLIPVFWNSTQIIELKVKDTEVNQRLFFFLPKDRIVPGWAESYYQVTRAGQPAPDEPSAILKLLVKLNRPAGDDRQQHLPWHSELDIVGLPEDVINNGVTKEWSAKGVPMTIKRYPDIRERDVIWIKWGSILLAPHEVTPAEADGTVAIVITALPGDILTAGDSAKLPIRYEVHDELWNYAEDWSKETTVSVEAGAARLGAAIFKDAEDGKLHLDRLDHQATNLLILIESNDEFTAGDTITIRVIGIAGPGVAPRTFTKEVIVGNPPYILQQPIPYEFVSLFATGTLDGAYVLHKQDGSDPLSSKRTFVDVIGNPSQLPAPTISEVIGAILPADSLLATVTVDYPAIDLGDTINLIWEGTRSGGAPYLHEQQYDVSSDDQEAGFTRITVDREHIEALANGILKLFYRVYNEKTKQYGISESDFLRVEVRDVRATLPAPEVEEAKDGVIDPTQVYTQAHVLVKPVNWVKDDILTYHWTGYNAFGTTKGSVPITQLSIGETIRFRVDEYYVTTNIGFTVTVRYTLLHAATGQYSYSAPLTVIVGVPLGRLLPPTVLQATGSALDPMKALNGVDIECRYDTMDEKLDVLKLLWIGTPGAGTSDDLEKPGETAGTVTFHLPSSVVGANILNTVSLKYAVQRHKLWTQSEELALNVLGFQNPETELPRPEVPQAVKAVLDLMEFSGDARVLVSPWPFIAKGQTVDVYLEGRTSTGTYVIDVLKGHEINEQQAVTGLNEALMRSELLKLLHSSPATVTCKVIFDGSKDQSAAILFPQLPLTIRTRYDYVTPIITSVKDQQDKEIPEAGLTYDKRVAIQGTATRGEKVNIRINNDAPRTVDVIAPGTWGVTAGNLTEGLQSITVEALYDADPAISKPRTFTIGIATRPSITAVTDSLGPVADNGSSYDTDIDVSVIADPNQGVQLYDGDTAIGSLIPLDGKGEGSTTLTNLTRKTYAIKARALYGDRLESPVHRFTIKPHAAITLTSVKHSNGELVQGGNTYDNTVTLTGAFTPLYEVQVYDNDVPRQIVSTLQNGTWTTSLAVDLGNHAVYVKAVATDLQSTSRNFTRVLLPPLTIAPTEVTISGYLVRRTDRAVTHPHAGTHATRVATGGVPPYRYSTDTPQRLQVDASSGRVIGIRNGSGRVIVTDSRGSTASYPVTIQNVWYIANYGGGRHNLATMNATANNAGGKMPRISDYGNMRTAYAGDPGGYANDYYWVEDTHAWGSHWLCRPTDGVTFGSNDNRGVGCIGVLLRT